MKDIRRNLTMLCDFYELTMANGFYVSGIGDKIVYFVVFYREYPDNGGFTVAAGLEQVVEYIRDLNFTEEDIDFLRGKGCFSEEFLARLRKFRVTGDIWGDGGDHSPACRKIIETVWRSASNVVIIALQDMCGFGSDARMNTPGVPEKNWRFRTTKDTIANIDGAYFRRINSLFRRTYPVFEK